MSADYSIVVSKRIAADQLERLYTSVGWEAYTADIDELQRAVANSTYVVTAWAEEQLIGLARALSDDVAVLYLQDILVFPDWQRRGVGRALMDRCLTRFSHVRQRVLLTDNQPAQHRFYEAAGYVDTTQIINPTLHAFVRLEGVESETGQ